MVNWFSINLELQQIHLGIRLLCWFQSWLEFRLGLLDTQINLLLTQVRETEGTEFESVQLGRSFQPAPVKPEQRSRTLPLPGQATLEWVLIGGIMVVIVVGLLITIFQPQLEAIVTNILNLIQQNTGGQATAGAN
jgi:hypothetical protein